MGLTARLYAAAGRRPHVLVVPVPGVRAVRAAAERVLAGRGWPEAGSPADADALLVCGDPGSELTAAIEVAWDALPGPRARAAAHTPDAVPGALDQAGRQLADLSRQREDARQRPATVLGAADLAMADRAEDRDGLRLDVLHVVLGPLLPGWPAGLRLTTVLQGGVLAQADAALLDARAEAEMPGQWEALDDLSRLLRVAGWQDGALRARRARDGLVPAHDVVTRVRRARVLRWSLRGLPGPGGGDLVGYLGRLMDRAEGDASVEPPVDPAALSQAVTGLDVGSAAMVVAAFGPHLRAPVAAHG